MVWIQVLEVGAGYTSIYILQALSDNYAEMCNYNELQRTGRAKCGEVPWCVEGGCKAHGSSGILYTVDSMEHQSTTAHKVPLIIDPEHQSTTAHPYHTASGVHACVYASPTEPNISKQVVEVAAELGLGDHLALHEADAWEFPQYWAEHELGGLDMLWVDFSPGDRLDEFLGSWWPLLTDGGHVAIHSTVTNAHSRGWLDKLRAKLTTSNGSSAANELEPGAVSSCMWLLLSARHVVLAVWGGVCHNQLPGATQDVPELDNNNTEKK